MRQLVIVLLFSVLTYAAAPTTKITIHVTNEREKPVANASVIVKFVSGHSVAKLGRGIRTEWELRTNEEGSVTIPPIPQGKILVQIIARNYQTYGETLDVDDAEKTLQVQLKSPQPQYTVH